MYWKLSGAALQWGHDLSVVESPCGPRCRGAGKSFNGATTSRSWNPPSVRRRQEGSNCFNGATTSRSWNLTSRPDQAPPPMLRLQWGHDLSVVESPRSPGGIVMATELQWGHDLSVVESGPKRPKGPERLHRFNGATTSRSWNLWWDGASLAPGDVLQWGHDLSVVESGVGSPSRPRTRGFNGATTSRSWNRAL